MQGSSVGPRLAIDTDMDNLRVPHEQNLFRVCTPLDAHGEKACARRTNPEPTPHQSRRFKRDCQEFLAIL